MLTKHLALWPATAVAVLLSSPSLAQNVFVLSTDQNFQLSTQQTLESLVLNLQNPSVVRPDDVVMSFTSTVDQAFDLPPPIPELNNQQLSPSQQEAQRRVEQLRQQRQQQEQQKREAQEQVQQSLNNVLNQIQQAMNTLNQQNQQAAQQKQQSAIDRYLNSLTEEQRLAFQQAREEAARKQERIVEAIIEQGPGNEPQSPESSWLDDFPYYRDGELTGRWEEMWGSYSGVLVGTAGDGSSLTGLIDFSIDGDFLYGGMTFDGSEGSVAFEGVHTETGSFVSQTIEEGSSFFGGSSFTLLQDDGIRGALYGPNGENAGGEWSFLMEDGQRPGHASGHFGMSREDLR